MAGDRVGGGCVGAVACTVSVDVGCGEVGVRRSTWSGVCGGGGGGWGGGVGGGGGGTGDANVIFWYIDIQERQLQSFAVSRLTEKSQPRFSDDNWESF